MMSATVTVKVSTSAAGRRVSNASRLQAASFLTTVDRVISASRDMSVRTYILLYGDEDPMPQPKGGGMGAATDVTPLNW